ncbi:hypothetical protein KY284_007926 [Solanum tuberosum]|nr:hypothetical protein KY284_007926 [Solanum tuberosum]
MEYLSRLLHSLKDTRVFKFHPRCGKPGISQMFFVDDLLLFSRGDLTSVTMIQQCFNEFSKASGLLANLGKHSMYFGGVSLAKEKIIFIQWKPLITRITARISSWTAQKLSYAGRAQLIQSVIFGIQVYWAQLFMIPTKLMKMIKAYCRSYLWSGSNTITKKALAAWETLCSPKCVGGLNLTNMRIWNNTTIAKNYWDMEHKVH